MALFPGSCNKARSSSTVKIGSTSPLDVITGLLFDEALSLSCAEAATTGGCAGGQFLQSVFRRFPRWAPFGGSHRRPECRRRPSAKPPRASMADHRCDKARCRSRMKRFNRLDDPQFFLEKVLQTQNNCFINPRLTRNLSHRGIRRVALKGRDVFALENTQGRGAAAVAATTTAGPRASEEDIAKFAMFRPILLYPINSQKGARYPFNSPYFLAHFNVGKYVPLNGDCYNVCASDASSAEGCFIRYCDDGQRGRWLYFNRSLHLSDSTLDRMPRGRRSSLRRGLLMNRRRRL